MERSHKRARVSPDPDKEETQSYASTVTTPLASLQRSITPPRRSRSRQSPLTAANSECPGLQDEDILIQKLRQNEVQVEAAPRLISSPVQLTHIAGFPASKGQNIDTVKLRDILGDPMIRECWQFNYCFDVDFLMSQFDQDVRSLVKVKIVHGSWEKESANRSRIDEACSRYPNVESIVAYMPERFGTHHSKMMILLRHDDLAQIVIHTANMLLGDWTNMTQAVWRSPLLPLQKPGSTSGPNAAVGTGARFKRDLLTYLKAYGSKKTGPLVQQLERYDFAAIRAALVASVPSKQYQFNGLDSDKGTLWGWPALKDLMSRIPKTKPVREDGSQFNAKAHIVAQISSVATLGQTDKWLKDVFFKSLASELTERRPKFSIIFPTPDELRRSLGGYSSGGSIHMKTQSAAQQKQLQYLRPYLCQWAGDGPSSSNRIDLSGDDSLKREAGRGRAPPHIKTYIRFSNAENMDTIDWAMVTSANLSTQAWGAATNANGEVKISSWEIGVVVWPDLFADDAEDQRTESGSRGALMVPCFKRDRPAPPFPDTLEKTQDSTIVGFRMPYDLPLTPYGASDEPWCATAPHHLPDCLGQRWIV